MKFSYRFPLTFNETSSLTIGRFYFILLNVKKLFLGRPPPILSFPLKMFKIPFKVVRITGNFARYDASYLVKFSYVQQAYQSNSFKHFWKSLNAHHCKLLNFNYL